MCKKKKDRLDKGFVIEETSESCHFGEAKLQHLSISKQLFRVSFRAEIILFPLVSSICSIISMEERKTNCYVKTDMMISRNGFAP